MYSSYLFIILFFGHIYKSFCFLLQTFPLITSFSSQVFHGLNSGVCMYIKLIIIVYTESRSATRIHNSGPVSFSFVSSHQDGDIICPSSLTGSIIGPGLMFVCITRRRRDGTELRFSLNHDDARWRLNPLFDHDIDGNEPHRTSRLIPSLGLNITATSANNTAIQGDYQIMRAEMLVLPLNENSVKSFSVTCEVRYSDNSTYEKTLTPGTF